MSAVIQVLSIISRWRPRRILHIKIRKSTTCRMILHLQNEIMDAVVLLISDADVLGSQSLQYEDEEAKNNLSCCRFIATIVHS
mmetsp:Transcript_1081/g.1478  ORF Transcript_1081/g.1478 Transcript_1081/m.1478 type:complete len:83 (+) Transcript_1081:1145-1393(+)